MVEDTHTTETEKCAPVKDNSSSGSSTDSDGFGGSSDEKFYTVPLSLSHFRQHRTIPA